MKVTEIRLRAERKAGKLLKAMDKAKGTDYGGNGHDSFVTQPSQKPQRLSDMAISKGQSSRWQKLADVPDDESALQGHGKKPRSSLNRPFIRR